MISFILFAVARTMNNHYLERVKFSKTIELETKVLYRRIGHCQF